MSPLSKSNELASESAFPLFKEFIHHLLWRFLFALAQCAEFPAPSCNIRDEKGSTCVLILTPTCWRGLMRTSIPRETWKNNWQIDSWIKIGYDNTKDEPISLAQFRFVSQKCQSTRKKKKKKAKPWLHNVNSQSLIRYGYAWSRGGTTTNNPLDPATASARVDVIPGFTHKRRKEQWKIITFKVSFFNSIFRQVVRADPVSIFRGIVYWQ